MAVTVSGMFGNGNAYFADSPVVITIENLYWGETVTSPFTIVRVEVYYDSRMVGSFRADTGGQTSITFDISSALQAIWSSYDFSGEAGHADTGTAAPLRAYRTFTLKIYTEYMSSDDGGTFVQTSYTPSDFARCCIGHLTEWERSLITDIRNAAVLHLQGSNTRNGDASTKPRDTPERVGSDSITSWVDIINGGTQSVFYPVDANHPNGTADSTDAHAPIVLRDSQPYVDFLFLNRRGAIETCSGMTLEAMGIATDTKQYSRTERPAFRPTRSLMAIGSDGRRSWQMSSGYVTREWAEWWTMEFLSGKRKLWWMRWQGPGMSTPKYVPVTVKPAKSDTSIYDRSKQQMPHVDFTVTLALEG